MSPLCAQKQDIAVQTAVGLVLGASTPTILEGRFAAPKTTAEHFPAPNNSVRRNYTDFADEVNTIRQEALRKRGLTLDNDLVNMARKPDLKQIDRIAREVGGLTKGQRDLLHRAISKQHMSLDEI
jgi:hypothetical protein